MSGLDWAIVIVYLAAMIGMSVMVGRGQKAKEDYYLGGNKLSWWSIGISTMATQCSTNSLLGAPAFVAFVGGLLWLQYELALPLAMIFVMMFLLPFYRRHNVISVYEYLERRFDTTTRLLLSILFQFMRAFATGVTVYGIGLILERTMNVPFWGAVLLLAVVTVIYDMIGGMTAVVLSDVVQMVVLYGGLSLCLYYAFSEIGWCAGLVHSIDQARLQAIDFHNVGLSKEGGGYGFLPMLLGGFFLYCSYYGCDQSQVQRELSSKDLDDTNMSLFLNAVARFPLVLTYCLLGIGIAAYVIQHPELLNGLPAKKGALLVSVEARYSTALDQQQIPPAVRQALARRGIELSPKAVLVTQKAGQCWLLNDYSVHRQVYSVIKDEASNTVKIYRGAKYDLTVPLFVLHKLPHGIIGIIFVALFAAAMSSLDSTINSLSATTMQDIITRFWHPDDNQVLRYSKLLTFFWGTVCTIFAFFVGNIADSVIEAINKIGSVSYGPILATFVLAIMTRRANGKGTILGIVAGFAVNIFLWLKLPAVNWMWWNLTGCLVTLLVGYGTSFFFQGKPYEEIKSLLWAQRGHELHFQRNWTPYYFFLLAYAVLLIGICVGLKPFLIWLGS